MTVLEVIVDDLSERHGDAYTTEQIRAWAHILQMKKHDSYEEPPKKPFFKTIKACPTKPQGVMSPFKRIQYRSQCIDEESSLRNAESSLKVSILICRMLFFLTSKNFEHLGSQPASYNILNAYFMQFTLRLILCD